MVTAIGVNFGQGYGLGKPKPLKDLVTRNHELS
jgi:EAL domain-containing protein (putative c-di-GMP-specific phosphodiesterase class I)